MLISQRTWDIFARFDGNDRLFVNTPDMLVINIKRSKNISTFVGKLTYPNFNLQVVVVAC